MRDRPIASPARAHTIPRWEWIAPSEAAHAPYNTTTAIRRARQPLHVSAERPFPFPSTPPAAGPTANDTAPDPAHDPATPFRLSSPDRSPACPTAPIPLLPTVDRTAAPMQARCAPNSSCWQPVAGQTHPDPHSPPAATPVFLWCVSFF